MRPFVGFADAGELDISPLIKPENMFPFGEHGGFALIWTAPHAAEVHTFILPEGRGRWARVAAANGIEMARDRGFVRLWTKIAHQAPHVRHYAADMGMEPTGECCEEGGLTYTIYEMGIA